MSAREPLWFCHQCHAEMRPLMVPDPVCASCHGDFVEKMENPTDDPRQFAHEAPEMDDPLNEIGAPPFLLALQELLERGMSRNNPSAPTPTNTGGSSVMFEVRGPNMTRTIRLGGRPDVETDGRGSPRPPTMSSFLRPNPGAAGEETTINGLLMAQYLMALLGHRDPFNPAGGVPGMPESGRMGDYVFTQEALDQIISQIMERDSHRPVPAPEETIDKLPREVLVVGSATLELDCAVCKDQFKLETDDPDELVVVTLPCKHPFHQPCIIPWLKSSGTCPVCRYQLVAQPEQHPPAREAATGNSPHHPTSATSGPSTSSSPPRPHRGHDGPGFLSSLIGTITGNHTRTHSPPPRSGTPTGSRSPTFSAAQQSHRRSNSDPAARSTSSPGGGGSRNNNAHSSNNNNPPGGWSDD